VVGCDRRALRGGGGCNEYLFRAQRRHYHYSTSFKQYSSGDNSGFDSPTSTYHGLFGKQERLDIETVLNDIETGEITEVFRCGTAAGISPVGRLGYRSRDYIVNKNESGPVTQHIYNELTAIQYGEAEDQFSWVYAVS